LGLALALGTAVANAQTPPQAATPQPAAAAPVDQHARFTGTFNYVGGQRERDALNAAIERVVTQMNFITGPIARGRLREKNPVYPNIAIRFPPGQVMLVLAGRTWASPDNGAEAPARASNGDPVHTSQRIDHDHIVQVIRSDEGIRRNEYWLWGDGNTLTLRVTVTSSRLPAPVRYSLTYRR
jgi:hypothetical protein